MSNEQQSTAVHNNGNDNNSVNAEPLISLAEAGSPAVSAAFFPANDPNASMFNNSNVPQFLNGSTTSNDRSRPITPETAQSQQNEQRLQQQQQQPKSSSRCAVLGVSASVIKLKEQADKQLTQLHELQQQQHHNRHEGAANGDEEVESNAAATNALLNQEFVQLLLSVASGLQRVPDCVNDAVVYAAEALLIQKRVNAAADLPIGAADPKLATVELELGATLVAANALSEALSVFECALAELQQLVGEMQITPQQQQQQLQDSDDATTASLLHDLARAQLSVGYLRGIGIKGSNNCHLSGSLHENKTSNSIRSGAGGDPMQQRTSGLSLLTEAHDFFERRANPAAVAATAAAGEAPRNRSPKTIPADQLVAAAAAAHANVTANSNNSRSNSNSQQRGTSNGDPRPGDCVQLATAKAALAEVKLAIGVDYRAAILLLDDALSMLHRLHLSSASHSQRGNDPSNTENAWRLTTAAHRIALAESNRGVILARVASLGSNCSLNNLVDSTAAALESLEHGHERACELFGPTAICPARIELVAAKLNLATALDTISKDHPRSLQLRMEALNLHRKLVVGKDHGPLADTLTQCGFSMAAASQVVLRKKEEAVVFFSEALEIREQQLRQFQAEVKNETQQQMDCGVESADQQLQEQLVHALSNAGLAMQAVPSQAAHGIELLQRAVSIAGTLPHATRLVAVVRRNLVVALRALNRLDDANRIEIESASLPLLLGTNREDLILTQEEATSLNVCLVIDSSSGTNNSNNSKSAEEAAAAGARHLGQPGMLLWFPLFTRDLYTVSHWVLNPVFSGMAPSTVSSRSESQQQGQQGQQDQPQTAQQQPAAAVAPVRNRERVETLFLLGPGVRILRNLARPQEIFVRYTLPRSLRNKANKLIAHTQLASRHPNVLMSLIAVKHRDGTVDVDVEYSDGGTLMAFIPSFSVEHRTIVAMAIARQVLMSLAYFDVVHDKVHRFLSPRYIYLRRDGCVKTDCYEMFDPEAVQFDQEYFLSLPYTAPECAGSVDAYFRGDGRADVWSVGVTIVAVMSGRTLLPPAARKPRRSGDPMLNNSRLMPQPTTVEQIAYDEDRSWFKGVLQSIRRSGDVASAARLRELIPDNHLRYLVRRCLAVNVAERATVSEALALTMLFGGVQQSPPAPPERSETGLLTENTSNNTGGGGAAPGDAREATRGPGAGTGMQQQQMAATGYQVSSSGSSSLATTAAAVVGAGESGSSNLEQQSASATTTLFCPAVEPKRLILAPQQQQPFVPHPWAIDRSAFDAAPPLPAPGFAVASPKTRSSSNNNNAPALAPPPTTTGENSVTTTVTGTHSVSNQSSRSTSTAVALAASNSPSRSSSTAAVLDNSCGPQMLTRMTSEPLYTVQLSSEVELSARAIEVLNQIALLTLHELQTWRQARTVASSPSPSSAAGGGGGMPPSATAAAEATARRSLVDKIMREVIKKREALTWKALLACINAARRNRQLAQARALAAARAEGALGMSVRISAMGPSQGQQPQQPMMMAPRSEASNPEHTQAAVGGRA